MAKPTHYLLIVSGETAPRLFAHRWQARATRAILKAAGVSSYIQAMGY